jgi:acyl carrier protein
MPIPAVHERSPVRREYILAETTAARSARCGHERKDRALDTYKEVVRVLDDTLNLKRSVAALPEDAPLLGGIPELDSMAVVSVIGTLEERFGVTFADDELDGSAFATVKSLVALVESKLGA